MKWPLVAASVLAALLSWSPARADAPTSAASGTTRTSVHVPPLDAPTRTFLRAMRLSRLVAQLLDQARTLRDERRATCYDEKLSEIDSSLRRVEALVVQLDEAERANQTGTVNYLRSVANILDSHLDALALSTHACAGGPPIRGRGVTVVTVTIEALPSDGTWAGNGRR